jgi:hypothetical protein
VNNDHCVCFAGWTGKLCELLGCTNDCWGNGACFNGTCYCNVVGVYPTLFPLNIISIGHMPAIILKKHIFSQKNLYFIFLDRRVSLVTIVVVDIVPTIALAMESVTRVNVFATQGIYRTTALC